MKSAKIFVLGLMILSATGCSPAARTAQENVNLVVKSSSSSSETAVNVNSEEAQNEKTESSVAVSPEAVVKDLYSVHEQDMKGEKDRLLNGEKRDYLDKYFDKNLANLIWKDLTTHTDEVGVLDFDPFYNSQDADVKNLVVGQAKIEGAKASVPVTFTNYKQKETITYALVQENGEWKISDIRYKNGDSLLKYFKEDAKNNQNNSSENGNFEGTYQVGTTTATVKPTKMAFELKWANGTGTMIFFYTGQGVLEYSTEDKGKGADKFIFDDASLTTGKFIRADGKEMPVKKIK